MSPNGEAVPIPRILPCKRGLRPVAVRDGFMEVVSLHPIEDEVVRAYVAGLPADMVVRAAGGSLRAANALTFGLAAELAQRGPSFASRPFGLSFWEAQVDRSLGMLMRPPARLFIEAGLERRASQSMPIRLETQGGTMGGAWLPARLVPAALDGFDAHLERSAKRLVEAEIDAILALELMRTALVHARDERIGLLEAQDLIVPGGPGTGQAVYGPDAGRMPRQLLDRIESAITPPRKPTLLDRLFRRVERVDSPESTNGHGSDVTTVECHEQ